MITSLTLSQPAVAIGDSIACTALATDLEGEIPAISYEWTNVTTGMVIGNTASITLTAVMATGQDELLCTATASDSYGETDTESITIIVGSTARHS